LNETALEQGWRRRKKGIRKAYIVKGRSCPAMKLAERIKILISVTGGEEEQVKTSNEEMARDCAKYKRNSKIF